MTTINQATASQGVLDAMKNTKTDKTVAEEAQDRFMTLLVTQMKNQDPLNPLDNAQVTSQLAQLSTVTGIEKMNTTLQALISSQQASQSVQAASMIGHGVLVPGTNLTLTGGKAIFGVELSAPVDEVTVTIRDKSGNAVHTMKLDKPQAGTLPLSWDGKNGDGASVADGKYVVEVAAKAGGQKSDAAAALTFGEVLSVSTGAQGVKINIPSTGAVNLAEVRQIL
jgi:flagellar basal-body rod modification protein FlgD